MNHEKRNHKQKIKKSSTKYKKTKKKKPSVNAVIKKKVFKVGSSTQELRMQFHNFLSRYVNIKLDSNKRNSRAKIEKDLSKELKINYNEAIDINGLTLRQMQYRVRRLKEMLDSLRKKRKNSTSTNK